MTTNKRRKDKIRAQMDSSGSKYTEARRSSIVDVDPVDLSWIVGTTLDGLLLFRRLAHTLVTGISASTPEATAASMIAQLSRYNGGLNLEINIVDTNRSMAQHLPDLSSLKSLKRYVTGTHHEALDLITDMHDEMRRRYRIMDQHGATLHDIDRIRLRAIKESRINGTDVRDHPLYLPHILFAISDYSTIAFLGGRPEGEVNDIIRMGRAAGIHVVLSTSNVRPRSMHYSTLDTMDHIIVSKLIGTAAISVVGSDKYRDLDEGHGIVGTFMKPESFVEFTRNAQLNTVNPINESSTV